MLLFSRVTSSESLWNPTTWNKYAYTEAFHLCDCPSTLENITMMDFHNATSQYGSNYYEVAMGVLKCSNSLPCMVEHEGLSWNGSVRPDFDLGDVQLNPIAENNVAYLHCVYNIKQEFTYTVEW